MFNGSSPCLQVCHLASGMILLHSSNLPLLLADSCAMISAACCQRKCGTLASQYSLDCFHVLLFSDYFPSCIGFSESYSSLSFISHHSIAYISHGFFDSTLMTTFHDLSSLFLSHAITSRLPTYHCLCAHHHTHQLHHLPIPSYSCISHPHISLLATTVFHSS